MPKTIETTVYTYAELKALAEDPDSPVNAAAVERARYWLSEGVDTYDWWSYLIKEPGGMWVPALEQIGFIEPDISFSGFSSQGDGASFTCKQIDIAKLARFLAAPPEASESVGFDGTSEDFLPWIVHQCRYVPSDRRYSRLASFSELIHGSVTRIETLYVHEYTCKANVEADPNYFTGKAGEGYVWTPNYPRTESLVLKFKASVEVLRLDICKAIYRSLLEEYEHLTSEESLSDIADANEYTFDANGRRFG